MLVPDSSLLKLTIRDSLSQSKVARSDRNLVNTTKSELVGGREGGRGRGREGGREGEGGNELKYHISSHHSHLTKV